MIENLKCKFSYRCPLRWEGLTELENDTSRFCADCGKTVHFALDPADINKPENAGKCFAITYTENIKFTEESNGEEIEITFPENPRDKPRHFGTDEPPILMGMIVPNDRKEVSDWAQQPETENKPASFLSKIFGIFKK